MWFSGKVLHVQGPEFNSQDYKRKVSVSINKFFWTQPHLSSYYLWLPSCNVAMNIKT